MKITPLEIRQKTFEKAFRGLNSDEVHAFLLTLSQEWEKILDEQKELRTKLASAEKEVEKLREVESSLFKTLKTAENTGANMIEQATKAADLHIKETHMRAEAMMNEAKSMAKNIIQDAEEKARTITGSLEEDVRALEQTYKTLENYRDNLISDLKNMAGDIIEKTERINSMKRRFSYDEHIKEAIALKTAIKKTKHDLKVSDLSGIINEMKEDAKETANKPETETKPVQEERSEPEQEKPFPVNPIVETKKTTSFFDEI